MKVILFDIDGTLISTGGAGQAALDAAFRESFGRDRTEPVSISGRTDHGIIGDLFRLHGIVNSPENHQQLRTNYLRHLPLQLQQRPGRKLPGVGPLLDELAERPNFALGLLTGNLREGARIKLEHFAMFHRFRFGGFGDISLDRNHVAELAFAAAQESLNRAIHREATWIIGDTPLDITCARWIGARVCAVATGMHKREELEAHQPDLLLDDLDDPTKLLSAMGK